MEKRVEDLILNNTNLIYMALKKLGLYSNKGIENYYDVGMIGLVKGAINYKNDIGIKPSTYLGRCIINSILMELRKENKIPNENNTISLSVPVYEDILLEEVISSNYNLEKEVEENNDIREIYIALDRLNSKEKYVIIHSFGLYNQDILKQNEMAEIIDCNQASISRIKKTAIKKIRRILNEERISN